MSPEVSLPSSKEPVTFSDPSQVVQITPPSYFFKIPFNIILPSSSRSSKWSFFRCPNQNPVSTLSLPIRSTIPAGNV